MTRVSMRQISAPVQIYFVNTKFNPHQINNSKAVQLVPQIWQEASQARLSIESNKYIYLLVIRNSFFCIVHQTRQICLLAGPKRHQRIFGRWIFWIFGLLFFCIAHQPRQICLLAGPKGHKRIFVSPSLRGKVFFLSTRKLLLTKLY